MNAFEDIVTLYLESEGYWVRQSVKVDITKDEKKAIGLPTMPRPEIDLVALSVKRNELLLVEVKSFLDSYGVYSEAVCDPTDRNAERYRLFTNSKFRIIVTNRMRDEYLKLGLINSNTKINYALAAGNIHSATDEQKIQQFFVEKGWRLFSPEKVKERIRELSEKGWEDSLVTMTAKLVMRD